MSRALLGDSYAALPEQRLGAALAGEFRPYVDDLRPVDRARIVAPWLPGRRRQPHGAAPAESLHDVWLSAVHSLALPNTPTRHGVAVGVVFAETNLLQGWTLDERRWLVETLGSGELVAAAHVVTAPEQPPAAWLWPLDAAFLDDEVSRDFNRALDHLQWAHFLSRGSARLATTPIELLILPHDLASALAGTRALPAFPRVQAVLVLGGVGAVGDPLGGAEDLRARCRADGVCIADVPDVAKVRFIDDFLCELSHDIDVDVAFAAATRESKLGPPLMVACIGGFARAHASQWARQVASRLIRTPSARAPQTRILEGTAPQEVGLELARVLPKFRWESESNEASDLVALGTAAKEEHPDPAARERRVQAQVFAPNGAAVESEPLERETTYRLEVWIGPPIAAAIVAPAAFPEALLPPSPVGHQLTIVLTAPALSMEPVVRRVHLAPCGPTERVSFELSIGRGVKRLDARITVLHENRIVQTLILSARVGKGPRAPLRLGLEGVVRRDLDGLAGRRPFDVALLFNDAGGLPTMSLFKDAEASLVRSDRIGEFLEAIADQLQDATNRPTMYGPPDKKASSELLGDLARQGSLLREALLEMGSVKDKLADAKRIQIVAAKAEDVLPLEVCYDGPAPRDGAKTCPHWKDALASGSCTPACPSDRASVVCPVAFWGSSRCIERHAYAKADDASAGGNDFAVLQREPTGRKRLKISGSSLCAAAKKARAADAAAVDGAFAAAATAVGAIGRQNEVTDWAGWRRGIASDAPTLLVLLPHTEIKRKLQVMVIDDKEVALLTDVGPDWVAAPGADGPIVLLLGCSTAKQQGLQAFTTKFRRAGAAIVIGTLCKVLGRHTGHIAARLIEKLAAASRAPEPTPIGDLMTTLRRELIAEGFPIVFALTAFGDADWNI